MVQRNYFDDADVAARYDDSSAAMSVPDVIDPAVEFLARLAGNTGAALEFGVGTGRLAIPLSRRIARVDGLDVSTAMIAQLRAKPGGDRVGTTVGDCTSRRVAGPFDLVYIVWNTIMNLTTQDEQVDCFRNAAAHLRDGGSFVVEVMVPELHRLPAGERFVPFIIESAHLGIDEYDIANQGVVSHHYEICEGKPRQCSLPFRYVWPAELDLMARLAGLRLTGRHANWNRDEFTSESASHVSVWRKSSRPG